MPRGSPRSTQHDPQACVAPDLYILPGVPQDLAIGVWKTWETGVVPAFAIEVVGRDPHKDDEEAPRHCEFDGTNLRLSATDTGGLGTIQIVMAGIPTASGAFTVSSDLGSLADAQIYISIGVDRESENQYVAQSGSVDVSVVTTDPQEINLVFADLPGTTSAGANGALSGNVGARDGTFVGACDFEGL